MIHYRITYEDGHTEDVRGYNPIGAVSMAKGIPEQMIRIERI